MLVCEVQSVGHAYGDVAALRDIDLSVEAGEIVALLGKNGSGKTTLFRLLCTLMPIQAGTVRIGGHDAAGNPLAVRGQIGIVFQSPSLDGKLTVDENIACQAALYGIRGRDLHQRRDELLDRLNLIDRRHECCETLSGGLKRRVELAKGMLHRPKLLLLDEPSTGLDPAARLDLWDVIGTMAEDGIAVLLTTHILDEAEKADRVVILADGRKIAEGSPAELREAMGDGVITIATDRPEEVGALLRDELLLDPQIIHGQVRLRTADPGELMPTLIDRLGDRADTISVGRPSLEDVFITRTGCRFDA